MKKKIIIGLAVFTSFFFLGGVYLVATIERATSALDNLITLHQVEIKREQLLIGARRLQSDLAFKNTRFARELNTVVTNVLEVDNEITQCLGCHHSEEIGQKLTDLQSRIDKYKDFLSRVLTIRANNARLEEEEDRAFMEGHELIYQLNAMTSLTKSKLEQRTRTTLKRIDEMKTLLFILISLGPVLAVGMAFIFIKGFTGPFNILLQATRRLKGGDLGFRIHALKHEFGEMAVSFNEMAESLKEQMGKMHRAEQMTMVGEMAAGLVHEIKNPVTGIKASLQLVLEGEEMRDEDRTILANIRGEVERIEALMKNLLNFAKPPQPLLLPANMNDILESTLSFSIPYSSSAANSTRNVEIVKKFDPALPVIMADPMQMQQVFLNLLMNAAEAMPRGGVVEVRTSGNGPAGGVRIEISDTGAGIQEGIMEKIFRPFFTAKHKGTGLGLAISKQYVEMHGGTIAAENNPGGGATFRIDLPGPCEAAVS